MNTGTMPFRNALIGGKTTYAETFQVGQLAFETGVEEMNKEIRKLEKKFGT